MSICRAHVPLAIGLVLAGALAACRSAAPSPTTPLASPSAIAEAPASATVQPAATSTRERATMTPTATSTVPNPPGKIRGRLVAQANELGPGGCTQLQWSVPLGRQVTLDGDAVTPVGTRQVCPSQTTTYTLVWVHPDGTRGSASVVVVVTAPTVVPTTAGGQREEEPKDEAPSPVPPTSTPAAPPTATDCGDECDPWSPPWPTDTPGPGPTAETTEAATAEPPSVP